tara:strand:- start:889 stop:1986 length:1098 start_codon:yes stop_codon:yes gene_type:complete
MDDKKQSLKTMESFLLENKCKNILLVTGNKSFAISGAENYFKRIPKLNFIRFKDFSQNTNINDLEKGVDCFQKNKCDSVVAVGGGSVMDMGKLIALLGNFKGINIDSIKKYSSFNKRNIPLVCIPTTAGSGSECTHFAVLYDGNIKHSIANNSLLPDEILLEPKFSFSTNTYQRAVSGLDALAQGIESLWAKNANKESQELAKKSIKLVWGNLFKSVVENNFDAHKKVFEGSILAGKAINISKTTAPHALSYYFTTEHKIPHGHAVALTLNTIFNINRTNAKNSNDDKIKDVFKFLDKTLNIKNDNDSQINNFISSLGIELSFKNLGINLKEELKMIKSIVNLERLNNNPFNLNLDNIFKEKINE